MDEKRVSSITSFDELDLGTGSPTSVSMETIDVQISGSALLTNFAKAFVQEAQRKSPLRFQVQPLTAEEVDDYCQYLLYQRVLSVKQECPHWRKLKVLFIPSFVQYNMSLVGKVVLRQFGLTLQPTMEPITKTDGSIYSYDDALIISEKIAAFEDCLQMVQDAMPRGIDGDVDVMSTALISGYVRSMHVVKHLASTYVAAFMNLTLQKEAAFSALYRVQYDDINFITSALCSQKIV